MLTNEIVNFLVNSLAFVIYAKLYDTQLTQLTLRFIIAIYQTKMTHECK